MGSFCGLLLVAMALAYGAEEIAKAIRSKKP